MTERWFAAEPLSVDRRVTLSFAGVISTPRDLFQRLRQSSKAPSSRSIPKVRGSPRSQNLTHSRRVELHKECRPFGIDHSARFIVLAADPLRSALPLRVGLRPRRLDDNLQSVSALSISRPTRLIVTQHSCARDDIPLSDRSVSNAALFDRRESWAVQTRPF